MNLKRKLLQCIANLKFNKTCLNENIVPKYAVIKVIGVTKASINTKRKVCISVVLFAQTVKIKLYYFMIGRSDSENFETHILLAIKEPRLHLNYENC
jgi:hypothetical protein